MDTYECNFNYEEILDYVTKSWDKINEYMEPNETRKDKNIKLKPKFVTARHVTKVGSLNVRSIRDQFKRDELFHLFESSGMSVLAVQEHKIVDESKEIGSEISANGSKMFFHQ